MVYAQGQFSKRGDIVDVFSSTADYPLRIEFFEDEIESIRSFDPTTQRTVKKYSEQSIFFATVFGSYKDLKVRAEGSPQKVIDVYDVAYSSLHENIMLDLSSGSIEDRKSVV